MISLHVACTQQKSTTKGVDASIPRYQEAVLRIHSSLVIAPSIPGIPGAETLLKQAETDLVPSNDVVPGTGTETASLEQVEIPFVPAHERQTQSLIPKVEGDAIVTVGRTRERKRKRPRLDEPIIRNNDVKKVKDEVPDTSRVIEAVEPKTEEFDYGSAPNFLDEPAVDQSPILKPQKGKSSKGTHLFCSID